jgi:hypothetical protein
MVRTFSQADWTESLQRWEDGKFSPEWREYRHQAAMRGIIFPPEGERWDSWEDDNPSQRAILIRAIRETPKLVKEAIFQARSWDGVIAYIVRRRDEWREELDAKDREVARQREADRPPHREAVQTIASILERIDHAR